MPHAPFGFAWLVVSLPASRAPFPLLSLPFFFGPVVGGVSPPLALPSRSLFLLVLSLLVCLPPWGVWSALVCLLYLHTWFLPCRLSCLVVCTLGLVPGLSGRRLVQDFQHRPFPPTNFIEDSALSILIDYPFLLQFPRKDSSVVLLAVDWSGVSLDWTPQAIPFQHCLWP